MEEAARRILAANLDPRRAFDLPLAPPGTRVPGNIADAIGAIVDPIGGIELNIPPREADWEPPDFSDPDEEAAA